MHDDLVSTAEKISTQQLTPLALAQECLDRAEAIRDTNAFISINADEVLTVAAAFTDLLKAGHKIGPLHGIPIAIKDNIAQANTITTAGSKILANNYTDHDASVVKKLRAAGAIIFGKTNLHEFAWGATSANPHYGFVKNAWNSDMMAGGSSGGSGTAVAAGACLGALGSDTGGSVRIPAALNGITGLRPTIGRISNSGVIPLAWSLDTIGPLTRSARDCAALLSVLAGYDPTDPGSAYVPGQDYGEAVNQPVVQGLRIGLIDDPALQRVQPNVGAAVQAALDTFGDLGATLHNIHLPDFGLSRSALLTVIAAEPSAYHQRNLRKHAADYGDDVRLLLQAGELIPAVHYLQASRFRTHIRTQVLEALRTVDVIALPTLPYTAPKLGSAKVSTEDGKMEDLISACLGFTALSPVTGLPSISIPCGFDHAKLPIGLQIIARPLAETELLCAAAAYQEVTHYHLERPY